MAGIVANELKHIYKLCKADEWTTATRTGLYAGSPDDKRDGFIHFSTAEQLAGTAHRHFRGQTGLVVVAFDAGSLGTALRWEPSRGGDLFPHLYAPLPTRFALWVKSAPLDAAGLPILPKEL